MDGALPSGFQNSYNCVGHAESLRCKVLTIMRLLDALQTHQRPRRRESLRKLIIARAGRRNTICVAPGVGVQTETDVSKVTIRCRYERLRQRSNVMLESVSPDEVIRELEVRGDIFIATDGRVSYKVARGCYRSDLVPLCVEQVIGRKANLP